MRIFNRNSEGYLDPTVGEAFMHIACEENRLHQQQLREQKKQEQLAEATHRKSETQQMLKRLDETNGWALAWTRNQSARPIKRKETQK